MNSRARAPRWRSMASDTFRSPHGPCPPSNTQLRQPTPDFARGLTDKPADEANNNRPVDRGSPHRKGGSAAGTGQLIALTVPELRRLLNTLIRPPRPDLDAAADWSWWRRR